MLENQTQSFEQLFQMISGVAVGP